MYVSDGSTSILVDAGLSGVEVERRLAVHGINPTSINAIVVSHEHSDHIKGVGILCRRHGMPAYFNKKTWAASSKLVGKIKNKKNFSAGKNFNVGGLKIRPFSISHDAKDPVGFTISGNGAKIGIATDLGVATAMVARHLCECQALLIEANHDPEMLKNGPYPWHLKQRVGSRSGHLSNEASRDLLASVLHDDLSHVILGHLSENNNLPEIALDVVSQALNNHHTVLTAAQQDVCGEMVAVRAKSF